MINHERRGSGKISYTFVVRTRPVGECAECGHQPSPKPATNTDLRVVLSVSGVHCNILEVKGAAHVDRGNDIPAMERARDEVSKGESRRQDDSKTRSRRPRTRQDTHWRVGVIASAGLSASSGTSDPGCAESATALVCGSGSMILDRAPCPV